MHVRDVMTSDPRQCYPDEPLLEAAARLATSGGHSFIVVASPEKPDLVGMLTLRDVADAIGRDSEPFEALVVSNVMSRPVHVCRLDHMLWEAVEAMLAHGVRHLPVVDGEGRAAGLISLTDLARVAISDEPGSTVVLSPNAICEVLVKTADRTR